MVYSKSNPYAIQSPRSLRTHWHDHLKKELESLNEQPTFLVVVNMMMDTINNRWNYFDVGPGAGVMAGGKITLPKTYDWHI